VVLPYSDNGMRYLLLVLVVCSVGILMVPNAFAVNERTVTVQFTPGSTVPGCEQYNSCFIPNTASIRPGDTITWDNSDTAAHTATSGSAADGPSGVFDSSLIMVNGSYSYQFTKSGLYNYYCMVHPWSEGSVIVKEGSDWTPPSSSPPPSSSTSKIYSNIILDLLPTTFKAKVSDSRAAVTFSGELESADKKFFLSGATITLKFTGFTVDEKKYYEITTDNKGKFNKVITLPPGKDYRVQAVFDGGESTSGNIWTSSKSQTEYFIVTLATSPPQPSPPQPSPPQPSPPQPSPPQPSPQSSGVAGMEWIMILIPVIIIVVVVVAIKSRKKTSRTAPQRRTFGVKQPKKRRTGSPASVPPSRESASTFAHYECPNCHSENVVQNPNGSEYCPDCGWKS